MENHEPIKSRYFINKTLDDSGVLVGTPWKLSDDETFCRRMTDEEVGQVHTDLIARSAELITRAEVACGNEGGSVLIADEDGYVDAVVLKQPNMPGVGLVFSELEWESFRLGVAAGEFDRF